MIKAKRLALYALVSAAPIFALLGCGDSTPAPITTTAPTPPADKDPGPATAAGGVTQNPAK